MYRQLSYRQTSGISVSLEWDDSKTQDEPIRVHVVSPSEDFILYPAPQNALDCFHHPFAYAAAAINGKSTRVAA